MLKNSRVTLDYIVFTLPEKIKSTGTGADQADSTLAVNGRVILMNDFARKLDGIGIKSRTDPCRQ